MGGIAGLVLAYVSTDLFNLAVADIQKPYWIDMRTDLPALLFTVGTTLFAAMAAGTIPALRATGSSIGNVLNDESRGSSSLRLGRMSGVLVVGELAVSCALLIGAGLMVRSVINSQQMDLGFDRANLMTARVGLFETDYPTRDDRQLFFRDLYQRLNEVPGTLSSALTTVLPSIRHRPDAAFSCLPRRASPRRLSSIRSRRSRFLRRPVVPTGAPTRCRRSPSSRRPSEPARGRRRRHPP